ncbi:MAG: hypothetical protein WCT04_02565 [Planctomycetota bacterium]
MSRKLLSAVSILGLCAIAVLTFSLTGCGGGSSTDAVKNDRDPEPKVAVAKSDDKTGPVTKKAGPSTGGGKAYDATMATGSVKGVVTFEGKPQKMSLIPVSEEQCKMHHGDKGLKKEDLVVSDDGKVANVVVFVSEGYKEYNFDSLKMANEHVNQLGCQYIPHVLAMKVDQTLEIESSDPVAHNVHGVPKENTEFNFSQTSKGISPTKPVFGTAEMGIVIKCDVHGWMKAYVCVFDHPFFAVTKADGTFEIKLPPGEYTVTTWQELQATKKVIASAPVKVKVEAGKAADASFTYKMKP